MSTYIPTIGIECHVQLKTKTKLFAAVGNDAREAPPNSLISHVCLGMPGALPVLNKKAVELTVRAAYALGTEPQHFSKFDRKHYFYPDLPKGYQISQYTHPMIKGGQVTIHIGDKKKVVGITRAHLEEDAGKNTHPTGKDYSLVDLNRAGTPLLEIVSEPDIHSASEARAFAHELHLLMKYADTSHANLFYGNMRFDVNVSVSKDSSKLGTRTETKNLNSFRAVEKTVEFEIKRQTELLKKGQKIIQETRGWDDARAKTFSQRTKEEAHDYRYFPDPDIPPVMLDPEFLNSIKKSMGVMPESLRGELATAGLDSSTIETLVDVPDNAVFVQTILGSHGKDHARRVANWIVNASDKSDVNTDIETVSQLPDQKQALQLSQLVSDKKLSSTASKGVWLEISKHAGDPLQIARDKNLLQVSDEGTILEIVKSVLVANSKAAEDVAKGEIKAIGFLVGQVMKESKGQANPALAQKLIKKELGI